MAITTRSMASMRRRSSRKPVPKLRDGFVQFMVGAHLARKQAPLRKRKAVKGCRLRCCDPNAVLCPSSPLPEEREYGITDLVPDPDESVAPFDYEQAVRDHYPCDKCHQKGPDSILMRHNPRNKMGSMDDILCEECLVSCISIIMDEGRDSEYRKKYMSQWIRVPVPKPETSRPLVPLEQGGQYRCRECKTMPNKVAFRVLHKEGDTEPGIYCEPCDGENNKLSGHVAPLTDITTLLGVHAIGAPVPVDYD
eukprot:jgi/Mesvir1/2597/Mv13013-RA.1